MPETEQNSSRREATDAPGRPTDELVSRLAALLRAGNRLEVAAEAVGLDAPTLDAWLRKGALSKSGSYHYLHRVVVRARAEGEARFVAVVASAAREHWQAAAWMLERGYPDRWTRLAQREKYGTPEKQIPKSGDPLAEVDDLARRRRER